MPSENTASDLDISFPPVENPSPDLESLKAFVFLDADAAPDTYLVYKGDKPFISCCSVRELGRIISDVRGQIEKGMVQFLSREEIKDVVTFYPRCRPFSRHEEDKFKGKC